jgi:hypothetical protein
MHGSILTPPLDFYFLHLMHARTICLVVPLIHRSCCLVWHNDAELEIGSCGPECVGIGIGDILSCKHYHHPALFPYVQCKLA